MISFVMQMETGTYSTEHKFRDELQWIEEARSNLNAFEPLYVRYYESVYLFVYRRCHHSEDCLDITSRVFEKAMLHIGKYKFQGYAFSTWLYRIAQNELADYFKKTNKEQKLWVRDEGLMQIVQDIQYSSDSEELLSILIDALTELSDSERELVVMRYFEAQDYETLAAVEQTSANYLRVKMHRILQKLRSSIERRTRI